MSGALPRRFLDKVRAVASGCWEWTGAVGTENGYGRFWVGGSHGTAVYAHRFAYETVIAPIPAGFVIDHLCRNRLCVNPYHLRACTQQENTQARYTPPPVAVCPMAAVPAVDQLTIFDADPTPAHGIVRPDLRVVGE